MLGMNDVGYGNTDSYLDNYRNVVEQIEEWQPGVIIYIMANLHISREKNNPDTEFNNININDKNAAAAELANGRDVFYLDCNPLFTDEDGFLKEDLTFDGVHLYAQCYDTWKQFLLEHCVEAER
jgi:lysophospholipase L1-like esterase